jgi:hypothetical protein
MLDRTPPISAPENGIGSFAKRREHTIAVAQVVKGRAALVEVATVDRHRPGRIGWWGIIRLHDLCRHSFWVDPSDQQCACAAVTTSHGYLKNRKPIRRCDPRGLGSGRRRTYHLRSPPKGQSRKCEQPGASQHEGPDLSEEGRVVVAATCGSETVYDHRSVRNQKLPLAREAELMSAFDDVHLQSSHSKEHRFAP